MNLSYFTSKDVMVVFTYAPAGLGHLRVTDALYEGLPATANPVLLGAFDPVIQSIHRITSTSVWLRSVMEWVQHGKPEELFTAAYRHNLQSTSQRLYTQLETLILQRIEPPKVVVVVSTHFGLAHQLAMVKDQLMTECNVKLVLALIVTDDSPQRIWYVPSADIIFVPSESTKESLQEYGRRNHLARSNFKVVSYPLSPLLGQSLSKWDYQRRLSQLSPESGSQIFVSLPVSGAATGLSFITKTIERLRLLSPRFKFCLTLRKSSHTNQMIEDYKNVEAVSLYGSVKDKEVVDLYQQAFLDQVISLEVTKPSEQAFKALFTTKQVGGAVLLFSKPIGRQEYDNLKFLERHELIPSAHQHRQLFDGFVAGLGLNDLDQGIHEGLNSWRGLVLPEDVFQAAEFIWWAHRQGLLLAMAKAGARVKKRIGHAHELGADGVEQVWRTIHDLVDQV